MDFLFEEKTYFALKIFRHLYFWWIQNIKIFEFILDITAHKNLTFWLFIKIWSDLSVFYGKHFELIFSSNVKTGN